MSDADVASKGVRGFEIDAHLSFARPLAQADAQRVAQAWTLRATLYGEDDVRAVRLTGPLPPEDVRRLLQLGFEGGVLRAAELGLRGFLRSAQGHTDYVPWTRTKVLPKGAWNDVALEHGVKYILE